MTDKIRANTENFETETLIAATGFREYDARWLYPDDLNLNGVRELGMGLGTLIHELGRSPQIVVGHDYRSYSASIKQALIIGLMASGMRVHDIGLSLSPMAYFAQFHLDCPSVAMVTASHNENGWTGVKMGAERPLTFGPELMSRLKDITLNQKFSLSDAGSYTYVKHVKDAYLADLSQNKKIKRNIKAVVACGNGTAGAFAPQALRAIGVDVIEMDCDLDYTFPHYNPNPEDLEMLHALSKRVIETGADIGFAFDGDGDRCGVVDNTGDEIFADKMGVIMARDLAAITPNAQFVVDVKSTGLFSTDPVLQSRHAKTDYFKTGHSYIKRRVHEMGALAGFEKSGHFFFGPPIGRGYDDGILTAITICEVLDRNPNSSMCDLKLDLPKTWGSPTMAPFCPDDKKYNIVDQIIAQFQNMKQNNVKILNQNIESIVTVNGVRFTLSDGTWGLIRASSNKPSLVVVVESPTSDQMMRNLFGEIETILAQYPDIGEFDQKLPPLAA